MTKMMIKKLPTKPLMRKAIGIILTIPVVLLVCLFILGALLLACSPGKPELYLDENGKHCQAVFQKKSL